MPGRGAPAKAVFDSLIGWDKHSDTGIRHFSGTATYRKTFEVSESRLRENRSGWSWAAWGQWRRCD